MKKIALFLFFVVAYMGVFSQYQAINDYDTGEQVKIKLNTMHAQIYNYGASINFSSDAASWHERYQVTDKYWRHSDDFGVVWSDEIPLTNLYMGSVVGGGIEIYDDLYLYGNLIREVGTPLLATDATNKAYVDGKAAGTDSVKYDSDYYFRFYLNGSVSDSARIDSTYHSAYSDTSTVANSVSGDSHIPVAYNIILPDAASVAARIASPVYLPPGWSLVANTINLEITHNLGRRAMSVTVFYTDTGIIEKQLLGSAAYGTITNETTNKLIIGALATKRKEITIYITFL